MGYKNFSGQEKIFQGCALKNMIQPMHYIEHSQRLKDVSTSQIYGYTKTLN